MICGYLDSPHIMRSTYRYDYLVYVAEMQTLKTQLIHFLIDYLLHKALYQAI